MRQFGHVLPGGRHTIPYSHRIPSSTRPCWCFVFPSTESENVTETAVNLLHEMERASTGLFGEICLVQGDQCGHVDDRITWQSSRGRGKKHVPGQCCQVGVGGDDRTENSRQLALVVCPGRDHQDRSSLCWPRASFRSEICPVDAPAFDHQLLESLANSA